MKLSFKNILTGFLVFIFIFSCTKSSSFKPINYSEEVAKIITHITKDYIRSKSPITVKFKDFVAAKNVLGKKVKEKLFSFNPGIDGKAVWKDRQTLKFIPKQDLKTGNIYNGKLNIDKIFKGRRSSLNDIKIRFKVLANEIRNLKADFEVPDLSNPEKVVYKGIIEFADKVEKEDLKKAVKLKKGFKKVDLVFREKSNQKLYAFNSSVINREDETGEYKLCIAKNSTNLKNDYEKKEKLEPVKNFKVQKIESFIENGEAKVRIKFSDRVKQSLDLRGLVRVTPEVDFKIRKNKKEVILIGDFQFNEKYRIDVNKGILSKWDVKTKKSEYDILRFDEIKPKVVFSSNGVFLPSANNKKLLFKTVNVENVHIRIKKVFDNNVGQFLQTEKLDSENDRGRRFNNTYLNRVGVTVVNKNLKIGDKKNQWLQHELDISKLLESEKNGLFVIELSFTENDILYDTDNDGRQSYNSNPANYRYYRNHGNIYKPVVLSDIGLLYKEMEDKNLVLATDIISGKPLSGIKVKLMTYQNQVVKEKETNGDGIVEFTNIDKNIFYILADYKNQRSIIKLNEMKWNLSKYDIGGVTLNKNGLKHFVYTERGVYRPGDKINFSLILRNEQKPFPDKHPITMKIFNPKGQLTHKTTNSEGVNGFYNFKYKTEFNDLTGEWKAKFLTGGSILTHKFKIETVVPYKLKIDIKTDKDELNYNDEILKGSVITKYLMGNPAAGLEANLKLKINHEKLNFRSKYKGFVFDDKSKEFKQIKTTLYDSELNKKGIININKDLPSSSNIPSILNLKLETRVLEKGGRTVYKYKNLKYYPYKHYAGIKLPDFNYGRAMVSKPVNLEFVLVDKNGESISGKTLEYKIYRNRRYWWWEYSNRKNHRLNYKSDNHTYLVKKGTVNSSNEKTAEIEFLPEEYGTYYVEVRKKGDNTHKAGVFFRASSWGSVGKDPKNAGLIKLKTDKEKYHPGEKAILSFPAPQEGYVFLTIEKSNKILKKEYFECETKNNEMSIEIDINDKMLPNAYASVMVLQPHEQTKNDRPLRMYGVIPLMVEKKDTHKEITIKTLDKFEPKKKFNVEVQTKDRKETYFTIAVVDEGLLGLTQYKTPEPWKKFFQKEKLMVKTYDLFEHVISANSGDIYKRFSLGGGSGIDYGSGKKRDRAKRFEPVSMFKGPLKTDKDGYANVSFNMPNYMGAVRIMVVGAKDNSYGHAEKTVPVKGDIVMLPTFPRVLGPNDKIKVPVTIFRDKKDIDYSIINIETEGPVQVIGSDKKVANFENKDKTDITFELKARQAIGIGKITLKARYKGGEINKKTEIDIRPSSPRIFETKYKSCKPGDRTSFKIPDKGLPGTNEAMIKISKLENLNLGHRLKWLMKYPYGCLEQTTSSVFPQIYLKNFMKTDKKDLEEINNNINSGIKRLRKFQTKSGGFSYWPGRRSPSKWGTNYAGHFLIAAKKEGYFVPEDLFKKWLKYQKSESFKTGGSLKARSYRVYLLALAGKPNIGAMNLLKENDLDDMGNTEKWLLAGAYQLAGYDKIAMNILKNSSTHVEEYRELGGTYGSTLRDKAIIMNIAMDFKNWRVCRNLYDILSERLSSSKWYSTQTSGYMLLAIGRYVNYIKGNENEKSILAGEIIFPDGTKEKFNTEEIIVSREIESGFGKNIVVKINSKTDVNFVDVSLEWDGVPYRSKGKNISNKLFLNIDWYDEDGKKISPEKLPQGKTIWGHFEVKNPNHNKLEEVALEQILPSGWEIENIRLLGQSYPEWVNDKNWKLKNEEYVDIRDDRITWFFDIRSNRKLDFLVKLNAVTVGDFILPPGIAKTMYDNSYKTQKKGMDVKVSSGNTDIIYIGPKKK